MRRKKFKRRMSEETRQKMREAYQRRIETKKTQESKKFDTSKDIRQQIWDWMGIK